MKALARWSPRHTAAGVRGASGCYLFAEAAPGSGFIDLDETWLVLKAAAVDDLLAARGYINPLTAMLMLKRWPVAGKHLVLTAASSLLRQSAGDSGRWRWAPAR